MAGTITGLAVQKRNQERVSIFIDGEFAFGLALIEALKLKKGQRLSDAEIARLKALDEIEVAHESALHYLSYRPRSVAELRQHLQGKQVGDAAIQAVIERLQLAGLLDDEAFTRFWLDNRQQFKPRSARALRYELKQKGIADETIADALDEFDEDEAAYQLASQRAPRYRDLDRPTFRKRLGDFLARNGFSYNTIRDVVERLWKEHHEGMQDSSDGDAPDFE